LRELLNEVRALRRGSHSKRKAPAVVERHPVTTGSGRRNSSR
jgi:hypothetical protein